jgi:peptidoglycan hydrolase-like protein with peptidoglycan-binding domain
MIQASVGRAGRNLPSDVRVIQQLLNKIEIPNCEKLVVDGMAGVKTGYRIEAFQKMINMRPADGRIDPNGATLKSLLGRAGTTNSLPAKTKLTNPQNLETDGVTVRFNSALSSEKTSVVSSKTIDVIKQAFTAAGVNYAVITDTIRMPEQQAKHVYNAAVDSGKAQYSAARKHGVNDEIHKMIKAGQSRAAIEAMIVKKIEELAKVGIRMSKHCVPLSVYKELNVVDIGVNSTKAACGAAKATFKPAAITKELWHLKENGVIANFIDETGMAGSSANNGAWHIEIKQ